MTSVALTNILTAMNAIKNDVVQAQSSGVSWDTLQQDIARQQQQITTYATNANFDGQNLLDRTWVETATEDQTLNYDGTNFQSGSGTENYTYDDGQGTKYEIQDDFTIDASGAQTYTKLGTLPANPFTQFAIPEGETGTGLQIAYFNMDDVNVLGASYTNPDIFTSPPDYNETVTQTINNDSKTEGPSNGQKTYFQYAYAGRNNIAPYSFTPDSEYSLGEPTHTYTGTGTIDSYGDPIPPYTANQNGIESGYIPLENNFYTVTPEPGILDFSLTDNQEYNFSDGPVPESTSPYDLTQSDLASYQDMVEDNIARTTKGAAELGGEMTALSNQQSYNRRSSIH